MKIIEAMKQIKAQMEKLEDLRKKVAANCANLDFESPMYPYPEVQIQQWLQAHSDIVKEILALRLRLQKTNLNTMITIELGGKQVTHCISEWIIRRRDLAKLEQAAWSMLTDRGLKEQKVITAPGSPVTEIKVKRHFDPVKRDEMQLVYMQEPSVIDRTLEVINATTELVE